jgi:hypothetical protein
VGKQRGIILLRIIAWIQLVFAVNFIQVPVIT